MRIQLALGLAASLGVSLTVWALATAVESARIEVEVFGQDLIRTSADVSDAAAAVETALRQACRRAGRAPATIEDSPSKAPTIVSEVKQWSNASQPIHNDGDSTTRFVATGRDRESELLIVETVGGNDMPTLIFIKTGDPFRKGMLSDLIAEVLRARLADHGLTTTARSMVPVLGNR